MRITLVHDAAEVVLGQINSRHNISCAGLCRGRLRAIFLNPELVAIATGDTWLAELLPMFRLCHRVRGTTEESLEEAGKVNENPHEA